MRVGVFGGSGYMGGEALRLLLEHPSCEVAWVTSRGDVDLTEAHPNLFDADVGFVPPEEIEPCDAALVSAPSGVSMEAARRLVDMGTRVIDLGADFRLRDRAIWERVYGREHTQWELAKRAVYGVPELHRDEIADAALVANPGCFSSAGILGLAPLVAERLVDVERVTITGLSGTAGMGAEQTRPSHHPEITNNLVPYNVVDHRHTYEIEQELSALASGPVSVHFTPIYVPVSRGILVTCTVFPVQDVTRAALLALYADFFANAPFIHIHTAEPNRDGAWNYRPYPWVSVTSGTNYCLIGLDYDERRNRLVVFSALDSLGKGGAHAGVENLNVMFGLDPREGLGRAGLHPY